MYIYIYICSIIRATRRAAAADTISASRDDRRSHRWSFESALTTNFRLLAYLTSDVYISRRMYIRCTYIRVRNYSGMTR